MRKHGWWTFEFQANVATGPCALSRQVAPLLLAALLLHACAAAPAALPAAADVEDIAQGMEEPTDLRAARSTLLSAASHLEEALDRDADAGERRSGASGFRSRAEPDEEDLDVGRSALDDFMDSIAEAKKQVVEKLKDEGKKQSLMSKINSLRAKLCWTRPDLWSHKECLEFLGIQCSKASSGIGICQKFKDGVKDGCEHASNAAEEKIFCGLAKLLGDMEKKEKDDKEQPQEEEQPPQEKQPPEEKQPQGDSGTKDDSTPEEPQKQPGDESGNDDAAAGSEVDTELEKPKETSEVESGGGSIVIDGSEGSREGEKEPVENPDRDGDGIKNAEDAFPDDPKESADLDKDGIGDNADPDIDGDGVPNDKDLHPRDKSRWTDDRDGDGTPDEEDVFPDDAKEWADMDEDGIGDNSDPDIDGDGVPNEYDIAPRDGSVAVSDRDGDRYPDNEDEFPDDPAEWKDTDGDGVGDNADAYPLDPNCWKGSCLRSSGDTEDGETLPTNTSSTQGTVPDDSGDANRVGSQPLPEHGYDEFSPRRVQHLNSKTWTGDWNTEWPRINETERESIRRICKDHPNNVWCKKYERRLRGS